MLDIYKYSHVMVDIETLGAGPDAAIFEIAAMVANTKGDSDTFIKRVSVLDEIVHGFSIDKTTVEFWQEHNELIHHATGICPNRTGEALVAFSRFLKGIEREYLIWANGASFDLAILRNHYQKLGIPLPWDYWQEMDYRTLKKMFGNEISWQKPDDKNVHFAIYDTEYQIKHLGRIFKVLEEKHDFRD